MEPISDREAFCRVVEAGSFTAAAEQLGLSKGAVSKYVARIEKRLGVRLLNRSTRRQTLTEAGEAYYARVARALNEIAQAEQEVSDQADRPRGQLRISVPAFFGAEILSRHIGEFHRRYPDIGLEISHDNRLVDLVEERFDAAIRMSAPRDSSLVMRKLADVPVTVCAAPGYIEINGAPEVPGDLGTHQCLIYTHSPRPFAWPMHSGAGDEISVAVDGSVRTDNDHTLRQAALDGIGIVRMPKLFVAGAIARGDLVELLTGFGSPPVTLAAVYPSRKALPAKVRAFVDFLVEISESWRKRL